MGYIEIQCLPVAFAPVSVLDPRGAPKLSEEASVTSISGSNVNDLVPGSSLLAARRFDPSLFWFLCPEATWVA